MDLWPKCANALKQTLFLSPLLILGEGEGELTRSGPRCKWGGRPWPPLRVHGGQGARPTDRDCYGRRSAASNPIPARESFAQRQAAGSALDQGSGAQQVQRIDRRIRCARSVAEGRVG